LLEFSGVDGNRGLLLNCYNNIDGLLDFIKVFKVLLYFSYKSRESVEYFISFWLMFLWHLLHLILEIEFKPLNYYILKIGCCKHDLSVFI